VQYQQVASYSTERGKCSVLAISCDNARDMRDSAL
jgi:hypothetical protein